MIPTVAFFSPVPDFRGGAERSLFDLMANPSVRAVLIVPEEGPVSHAANALGIQTFALNFGMVSALRRPLRPLNVLKAMKDWWDCARALSAVLNEQSISIVHSNGLKAHAIAALSRRLGGARCIVHIRDIAMTWSERSIWRAFALFADHIIFVSRACWPSDVLPKNGSVIFNSMPENVESPAPTSPLGPGTVVGLCGRVHPFKGHHLAITWLAYARKRGLDITLVIRGHTAPEDMDYLESLHRQVQAADLAQHIRFEGNKEGLAEIYGGLSAVLVSSDTPDPLPRSVMEALALGLPVIGYPAGGIVEMIDHGKNGWLAATAEEFFTAAHTISMLDQGGDIQFRRAAAASVARMFGRKSMFAKLNDVYAKLLQ